MAWVRYKKLNYHPERVHRVSNSQQDVLFDAQVNAGLVDIKHLSLLDRLLRTGDYVIALEKYGVVFDEHGVQVEPTATLEPVRHGPGRPKKG